MTLEIHQINQVNQKENEDYELKKRFNGSQSLRDLSMLLRKVSPKAPSVMIQIKVLLSKT